MAYLTINGIDVPVVEGPKVDPTEIGTRAVGISGEPHASIIARKRTWNVQTGMMTQANAAILRAALLSGATVAVTGDWIGTKTVWPKLQGEKQGASAIPSVTMTFTLAES